MAEDPSETDSRYREALRIRDMKLAEMQRLNSELRTVQNDLRVVEEFIGAYDRLFTQNHPPAKTTAVNQEQADLATAKTKRSRNILPPQRLAALCRDIILEAGRPMTRSELLSAFVQRGFPLVGTDPSKNLGTILWRFRDQFHNIKGKGYWPTNVKRG